MKITKFKITKLWGLYSYDIPIKDNKLILISENGEGKTIILRLLYYFLSKQWSKLSEYKFERISTVIDGDEYHISHSDLDKKITDYRLNKIAENKPIYKEFITKIFPKLLKKHTLSELEDPKLLQHVSIEHEVPVSVIYEVIDEASAYLFKDITFEYTIPIMFLPTYRRIEQEFSRIFEGIKYKSEDDIQIDFSQVGDDVLAKRWEQKESKSAFELVEFGMKDIDFLLNKNIDKEKENINKFIETINSFFVNKQLVFSNKTIEVQLNDTGAKHNLTDTFILSSGEKQLISVFFYLYIYRKNYFIIIDEPELSISIDWQEDLLSYISDACSGFIVATHSPTITTEYFDDYLYAIKEIRKTES